MLTTSQCSQIAPVHTGPRVQHPGERDPCSASYPAPHPCPHPSVPTCCIQSQCSSVSIHGSFLSLSFYFLSPLPHSLLPYYTSPFPLSSFLRILFPYFLLLPISPFPLTPLSHSVYFLLLFLILFIFFSCHYPIPIECFCYCTLGKKSHEGHCRPY